MNVCLQYRNGSEMFEWSKALETGHNEIDEQHQKWFAFLRDINRLFGNAGSDVAIRATIAALKDYVAMHFQHEERIMDSFNYDQKDMHKRAHMLFLKKVDELDSGKSTDFKVCNKLSNFIYEWLVSHIAKIDQAMVEKLNGHFSQGFTGDNFYTQTQAVIDSAFNLACGVEQLSVRLDNAGTASLRRRLNYEMADASERLINLISLAQDRVESFGCSDGDLDRLRKISAAVKTSVMAILKGSVNSLIDYGSKVLVGRFGLPFGVGAAMVLKIVRIGTLVETVGGFPSLDNCLKDNLERATMIANEVALMEGKTMPMPNFQPTQDSPGHVKKFAPIGNAYDYNFIIMAHKASQRIADLLDASIDHDLIGLDDLFDENYLPITGSDPKQYTTKMLEFTDKYFPDILEYILDSDESIIAAIAVDRNGYAPTHNKKCSFRQGADPVWNAAHCRNRRIFNDKTGIAAARNTSPILLQTYLRDLGGGEVAIVKDASCPIVVKGRHWGAFRLAYKIVKC